MATPWGMWKNAPTVSARACTAPTSALMKAAPAMVLASIMDPWACRSEGSCQQRGRFAAISSMARSASASEMGLAGREVKLSMAWVKASTPQEAIRPRGSVVRSSGSQMATSGERLSASMMVILRCSSVLVMTETKVTSLPVPAVVGTHTSGSIRLGMGRSSSWRTGRSLVTMAAIALDWSITLPPPRATISSTPFSAQKRAPSSQWTSMGSGCNRV